MVSASQKKDKNRKVKKSVTKAAANKKNSTDLPMHSTEKDESDVEENREVADLSNIPAPVIEFEMPSLIPLEDRKIPNTKAAPCYSNSNILTAELLNNEITQMRNIVKLARRQLFKTLSRNVTQLKKTVNIEKNEKSKKKLAKIEEETAHLYSIPKDSVSKFALVNTKTFDQLCSKADIGVSERCLYRIACSNTVVKHVKQFKSKYPGSDATIGFFLQRLGLQYAGNKMTHTTNEHSNDGKEKKVKANPKTESKEKDGIQKAKSLNDTNLDDTHSNGSSENEEEDGESEDDIELDGEHDEEEVEEDMNSEDDEDKGENEEMSDVEFGSDSEDDAEMANKRREMFLSVAGIKEDKSRPLPQSKKSSKAQEDERLNEVLRNALAQVVKDKEAPIPKKKKTSRENAVPKATQVPKTMKTPSTNIVSSSEAVVKKIKLNDGGKIAVEKRTNIDIIKRKEKNRKKGEEKIGEEDKYEAPVSSFFIADGDASPDDSSGEESVDDDEDVPGIINAPQRGGTRQLSKSHQSRKAINTIVKEKIKLKKEGKPESSKAKEQRKGKGVASGVPDNVHPSWLAARKAQEQRAVQPQGKRTIFKD